jgi:hypothetical protein
MALTLRLTPEEELEFQQFQQIDFWRNQSEAKLPRRFPATLPPLLREGRFHHPIIGN